MEKRNVATTVRMPTNPNACDDLIKCASDLFSGTGGKKDSRLSAPFEKTASLEDEKEDSAS